jgi:hypothetical protein
MFSLIVMTLSMESHQVDNFPAFFSVKGSKLSPRSLRWTEGTLNRLLIVTENEDCMGEAKSCIQGA